MRARLPGMNISWGPKGWPPSATCGPPWRTIPGHCAYGTKCITGTGPVPPVNGKARTGSIKAREDMGLPRMAVGTTIGRTLHSGACARWPTYVRRMGFLLLRPEAIGGSILVRDMVRGLPPGSLAIRHRVTVPRDPGMGNARFPRVEAITPCRQKKRRRTKSRQTLSHGMQPACTAGWPGDHRSSTAVRQMPRTSFVFRFHDAGLPLHADSSWRCP